MNTLQTKELQRKNANILQRKKENQKSGTSVLQLASAIGNQGMIQLMEDSQKEEEINNTGIPTQMKQAFENKSGFSFEDVKVHYNSEKPAQFQALAYTQGNQVYIGAGQEKHLGHELGHVVQQKEGRVFPTTTINGMDVNDNTALEAEADSWGNM